MTVLSDDVRLERSAVADSRNITYINHDPIHLLNGQHGEFVDGAWRGIGPYVVFTASDLRGTRRHDDVLRGHRGEQVARRDAFRLHLRLVHVDGDLRLLAAVGLRQHGARYGDQRRTHCVCGEIGKLLFVQAVAADAELQNGHAGSREVDDLRRKNAGRQLPNQVLRSGGDLRVRRVEARAGLQENLDDGNAVVAGRFSVLHVIDQRGQRLLVRRGQPAFDLFGVQARVLPGHCHDWNVDVRKDVGGCSQDHDRAQQQNQQRQHDERVGPVQRNLHNPHGRHPPRLYPSEKPLVLLDRRQRRRNRSLFRRRPSVLPMISCGTLHPWNFGT